MHAVFVSYDKNARGFYSPYRIARIEIVRGPSPHGDIVSVKNNNDTAPRTPRPIFPVDGGSSFYAKDVVDFPSGDRPPRPRTNHYRGGDAERSVMFPWNSSRVYRDAGSSGLGFYYYSFARESIAGWDEQAKRGHNKIRKQIYLFFFQVSTIETDTRPVYYLYAKSVLYSITT